MSRTLCVVFNNVDESSSIGSLCAWSVRTALADGWRVSVVARDLADDLRPVVEWLPLYVPPRLHAVQWYSALPTVRRAMGGRRWDVVHTQQPQLSSVADILHLHYLVRSARLAGPKTVSPGTAATRIKRRLAGAQTRLTEAGEHWQLGHLPESLVLVPVSGMLRDEFERFHGRHSRTTPLASPAPDPVLLSQPERAAARAALVGGRDGVVVGFLGGNDPRKGGAALLAALARTDAIALVAGHGSSELVQSAGGERVVSLGYVRDKRSFFAACDVFAAVSSFDPGPLTALEAAAHGVPVLGTWGCGIVRELAGAGAAVVWQPGDPIEPALATLAERREGHIAAGREFAAARGPGAQAARLLALYDVVRQHKRPAATRR